jgi:hypothetical protein
MGTRKGGWVPNSPWSSADTYRILASSLDRGLHGKWKCW